MVAGGSLNLSTLGKTMQEAEQLCPGDAEDRNVAGSGQPIPKRLPMSLWQSNTAMPILLPLLLKPGRHAFPLPFLLPSASSLGLRSPLKYLSRCANHCEVFLKASCRNLTSARDREIPEKSPLGGLFSRLHTYGAT